MTVQSAALHQLLRLASSDSTLLERFVRSRDEDAFAALVERHGPMVLRLCRRMLADPHAAEDAFQATFLVLARRAAVIRRPQRLAGWLHGVAYRVALKARTSQSLRHSREEPSVDMAGAIADPLATLTVRELLTALDEEVQRLPEVYRLPVLLCCLEGHTQEEAALRLGWTPGSVKGRLERGRARLRARLTRRGLSLSAALAAAVLGQGAAAVAVPSVLARTAASFAAGVRAIPNQVLVLAEAGTKGNAVAKITLGLVLLAGVVVGAAGVAAWQTTPAQAQGGEPPKPAEGKPPRTDLHGDPLPEGAVALDPGWTFTGTVLGPDDKPLIGVRSFGLAGKRRWDREGLKTAQFTVSRFDPRRPHDVLFQHREKGLVGAARPPKENGGSVTVRLEPGATVTGRLIGPDGKPRAGVELELVFRTKERPNGWHPYTPATVKTDRAGRFRIEALLPGYEYRLRDSINGSLDFREGLRDGDTKDLGDVRLEADPNAGAALVGSARADT